jgi:DNA-binding beta-propeller fold protein YncE
MGGPYSATRIVVRDPANGKIVASSPGEYSYPRALLVDDSTGRLYLVHRRNPPGVHMISSDWNTVEVLSPSTLRGQRRIQYADPSPNSGREYLSWSAAWLDAPRHRLIADFYGGTLGVLPLTGPVRATRVPVEGSLFSGYRLAGVLQRTGQPILLIDNAVRLLNARTLRAGAGISLGATIQDLFLDDKRHRLLAHVDRDVHEFLMLDNGVASRLFKSYMLPNTRLLAVDFDRERIYHVKSDGWGNAASLAVMNFRGEPTAEGYRAEGEFARLIVTDTAGRSFRLLYPAFPESVRALKRCSLDLMENGRETRSAPLPLSSAAEHPPQLLYAERANRAYVVSGQTLTVYAGSDLTSIGTVSLAALIEKGSRGLADSLAVDAEGKFAYYADPDHRQIVKLSLADGAVAGRRDLTFPPTLPLVDSPADRLYVADNDGGRVVAIRLF